MNKIKSIFINLVPPFLLFFLKSFDFQRKQKELQNSLKVKIQNEYMPGERVMKVKEDTFERVNFMKVHNHIESGEIIFKHHAIDVNRFSNALVFPSSDFIITENIAVWPKSKYPHFQKIIPLDKNLIKASADMLYVKKPNSINRVKCAFSLCGVASEAWGHFLVQYLPKINYLDDLIKLSGNSLTLLIPEYKDNQIIEIIDSLTSRYNELEVIKLREGEAAQCEILYHIENISMLSDHSTYISPSDLLIPDIAKSFLKEKFICDPFLFPARSGSVKTPFRKIFLSRNVSSISPLSKIRNLDNQNEVESFFVNEGFEIIVPHEYDLDQKRRIFREAKIIVGPASSGFTNFIFCQPGTKVLAFGNYQRVYDLYFSSLANHFNVDLLFVVDYDLHPFNIHSSYSISLDKIIDAYQNLIK